MAMHTAHIPRHLHLSGEVRATERADTLDGPARAQVSATFQVLGVPDLAAKLDTLSRQTPTQVNAPASFRLHHGRRRAMVQRPALVRRLGVDAPAEP